MHRVAHVREAARQRERDHSERLERRSRSRRDDFDPGRSPRHQKDGPEDKEAGRRTERTRRESWSPKALRARLVRGSNAHRGHRTAALQTELLHRRPREHTATAFCRAIAKERFYLGL